MRKILAFAVAAFAFTTAATTTWTNIGTPLPNYVRAVRGANPTSTGTDPAPVTSTATTDGIDLRNVESLSVMVETTTGGNMTVGGKLLFYSWNPVTGVWNPAADLDLVIPSAVPAYTWSGMEVLGDYGRVAFEPSGLGTTTNVYIFATKRYPVGR